MEVLSPQPLKLNTIKKIAFITNRKINSLNQTIKRIQSVFTTGYQVKFFITDYKGHSSILTQDAISGGFYYIICIGGDGSLNEVVNGVMQSFKTIDDKSRQLIRLGVLPKGTGNDFARTMQISSDIDQLKNSIEDDIYTDIDIGRANFINIKGIAETRYFINITDIGMGGVIAEKLTGSRWLGSFLTYQKAIINTLLNYKKQDVIAKADTFSFDGKIMVFAIANGKYFGGGLGIAPDALPTDGIFSIVIVGKVSVIEYLKLVGKLKNCKKITHPELSYYNTSEITIQSPLPMPIDMDGEFIGNTPLQISICAKAFKFLTTKYLK